MDTTRTTTITTTTHTIGYVPLATIVEAIILSIRDTITIHQQEVHKATLPADVAMTAILIRHLCFQETVVATQLHVLMTPLTTLEEKAAHQLVLTHRIPAEKARLHVLTHQAPITTLTQDLAQVLALQADEATEDQVAEALAVVEEEGKTSFFLNYNYYYKKL